MGYGTLPRWCSGLAYKPVTLVTRVQIPSEALTWRRNDNRRKGGKVLCGVIGGPLKEVDISKHRLVPKHTILSEKDKEELLSRYNINLNQLPRILTSDPQVKVLDAKIGDVIKIERESETAERSTYYRVVVQGTFK